MREDRAKGGDTLGEEPGQMGQQMGMLGMQADPPLIYSTEHKRGGERGVEIVTERERGRDGGREEGGKRGGERKS